MIGNVHAIPAFVKKADNKLWYGRSVGCPYRLYTLKQNNVTQIIDLRNNTSLPKFLEKMFCKLFGIKYINYNYSHRLNTLPDETLFENINKTVNAQEGRTYIHCLKGKRRTGLAIAYYEKQNSSKTDAEILSDILKNGYYDLKPDTKKSKKYYTILEEFMKKYLTNI